MPTRAEVMDTKGVADEESVQEVDMGTEVAAQK